MPSAHHHGGTSVGPFRSTTTTESSAADPFSLHKILSFWKLWAGACVLLAASYAIHHYVQRYEADAHAQNLLSFLIELFSELLRDLGLLLGAIGIAHLLAETLAKQELLHTVVDKFREVFATFDVDYTLVKQCYDVDVVHIFTERRRVVGQTPQSDSADIFAIIKAAHTITIVTTWFRHDDFDFNRALAEAIGSEECRNVELFLLAPESAFLEERVICAGVSPREPWTFCRHSLDSCLTFFDGFSSPQQEKVSLYLYDLMPWFDMILVNDRDAFISPYPPTTVAQHAPHFQVRLQDDAGRPTGSGESIRKQLNEMKRLGWRHPRYGRGARSASETDYPIAKYPVVRSLRPKRAGIIRVHPEFPIEWTHDLTEPGVSGGQIRIVTTWFFDAAQQQADVLRAVAERHCTLRLFMLHPMSPALAMRAKQTGVSFKAAIESICHTLKSLKSAIDTLDDGDAAIDVRLYEELPSAPIFEYRAGGSDLTTRLVGHYSMFSSALDRYFIYTRSDGFQSDGRRAFEIANAELSNFVHTQVSEELDRLGHDHCSIPVDLKTLEFPPDGEWFQKDSEAERELEGLRRRLTDPAQDPVLHYDVLLKTTALLTRYQVRNLPEPQYQPLPNSDDMSLGPVYGHHAGRH
jgi:hypothetical protein